MSDLISALEAHPAVVRARVHEHRTASGRVLAVAVVELDESVNHDPVAVQREVSAQLTEDQRPARLVAASSVDTLPDVGAPRPASGTALVALADPVLRQVADIWAELLGWEEVGADDDLYELGADSLTTVEAVLRITDLLDPPPVDGLPFEIAAVDARTVADYAALIDRESVR